MIRFVALPVCIRIIYVNIQMYHKCTCSNHFTPGAGWPTFREPRTTALSTNLRYNTARYNKDRCYLKRDKTVCVEKVHENQMNITILNYYNHKLPWQHKPLDNEAVVDGRGDQPLLGVAWPKCSLMMFCAVFR